jgi:hypothetical protein
VELSSLASFPLGYVLARTGEHLPWLPTRAYRGVDRDVFRPDPFAIQGTPEGAVWEDVWSAEESGELRRNLGTARSLVAELSGFGHSLEVIFCEAVFIPSRFSGSVAEAHRASFEHLEALARTIPVVDSTFRELGYDVSMPHGWHSVIFQPGPISQDESLAERLNAFGLLSSSEEARALMNVANATDPHAGILSVIRILG